jgi:hypothetical protein
LTLSSSTNAAQGQYGFTVTGLDQRSGNSASGDGTLVIGSNPNSAEVRPSLSLQKLPDGSAQITCTGVPEYSYQLQATIDLASPSWITIAVGTADKTGRCVLADSQAGSCSQRFYRAVSP